MVYCSILIIIVKSRGPLPIVRGPALTHTHFAERTNVSARPFRRKRGRYHPSTLWKIPILPRLLPPPETSATFPGTAYTVPRVPARSHGTHRPSFPAGVPIFISFRIVPPQKKFAAKQYDRIRGFIDSVPVPLNRFRCPIILPCISLSVNTRFTIRATNFAPPIL